MKLVKESIKENIKDYLSHKILCEMTKVRSPYSVMFVENMNDDWFIYVLKYKTKSRIIDNNHMIIKPDYENWIRHFEREGFELKK
jgi:hypothetical protein